MKYEVNFSEIYKVLLKNKNCTLIINFDHTITTYDSETTDEVFSKIFGKIYEDKKRKIEQRLLNAKLSICIKFLWMKKILLLKKYKADEYVDQALKYFKIRPNFIKLFNYCSLNGINVIIISTGYKDLIKEILNKNGIYNLNIIANKNVLKIVTPNNKYRYIKENKKNAIIISDDNRDLKMLKTQVFSIGICNDLYNYENLNLDFDIVLIDDINVLESHNTAKTKIAICLYNNKKYFIKFKNNNRKELSNYTKVKKYYKVSKIAIDNDEYIIYEYLKDFKKKTINDYLYGTNMNFKFKNIALQYKNSIDNTLLLMKENSCNSKRYFFDRLYMLDDYIDTLEYQYLILDGIKYDLKTILKEIKNAIKQDKKLYAFISQGDPTDTNITTTGYFTDFENGGYNTLLSELSIIFVSLFSHGRYFYPKYNKQAYVINDKVVEKIYDYNIKEQYHLSDNKIFIDSIDLRIPEKNKKIILEFINIYIKNNNYDKYSDDFNLIKYYICMRLLTPISINLMSEKDKILVLTLVVIIYSNIENLLTLMEFVKGGIYDSF